MAMTIDEAIQHCKAQAEMQGVCECATEHSKLAEWLEELQELRQWKRLAIQTAECVHCGASLSEDELSHWERCPNHPARAQLAEAKADMESLCYAASCQSGQVKRLVELGQAMQERLQIAMKSCHKPDCTWCVANRKLFGTWDAYLAAGNLQPEDE